MSGRVLLLTPILSLIPPSQEAKRQWMASSHGSWHVHTRSENVTALLSRRLSSSERNCGLSCQDQLTSQGQFCYQEPEESSV